MNAKKFKASVADLSKKAQGLRNLTEVAIEGEPLKVLLNRTHGADENVHLYHNVHGQKWFWSKCFSMDPSSGWKCWPMSSMLETKEFLDRNCQLYYWTKILTTDALFQASPQRWSVVCQNPVETVCRSLRCQTGHRGSWIP